MSRFNQDGNLLGRITALAALVAVVAGVGRICCGDVCPEGGRSGGCVFMSGTKAAH